VVKSKKPSRKFMRLLAEYAACYHDERMKGRVGSDEWPEIEENLKRATKKILDFVADLEEAAAPPPPRKGPE
jgi:hypothetical protein